MVLPVFNVGGVLPRSVNDVVGRHTCKKENGEENDLKCRKHEWDISNLLCSVVWLPFGEAACLEIGQVQSFMSWMQAEAYLSPRLWLMTRSVTNLLKT